MKAIKLNNLTSDLLTKNFNPTIGKVVKDDTGFSVEIKDQYSGLSFFMDVWGTDNENVDWNQYIFSTIEHQDIIRNEFQSNCDNFEICSSLAVEAVGKF